MLRSLLLAFTLFFATTTFALDFGDIFTPTDGDYSVYIISKIFGDVEPSILPSSDSANASQLLGTVFRVFNTVALAVGVLMVIYTIITAALHTAHHGKMMGEKMSSMWVPIRITFAMAMLIPKANGYCLAQVCVMWLAVQGIGAADTVWNEALDYFESGGSIGGEQISDTEMNNGLDAVYANMLGGVLRAVTCVSTHNEYNQSLSASTYEIYGVTSGSEHYLQFGRKPTGNNSSAAQAGYECGRMKFNVWSTDDQLTHEQANLANATQMNIVFNFAKSLQTVAQKIATDHIDLKYLNPEFDVMKIASLTYVNAMLSNHDIFLPENAQVDETIAVMREQGWITAGNYYQVLASMEANYIFKVTTENTPTMSVAETVSEGELAREQLQTADYVYDEFKKSPISAYTSELTPSQQARDSIENAMSDQSSVFNSVGMTDAVAQEMATFIDMIGGTNGGAQDPIVRAAQFGQGMMETSAAVMIGLSASLLGMGLLMGICSAYLPGETSFIGVLASTIPMLFGLMSFMYMQGAMLGVYLPMVSFIVFAIGAVGWLFSVVESMIAAPLVAIGMVMESEGRNEIYGRAEPAYMLLINLFLRPSLMIIGFIAAIMVAWVAVDLVNFSFYSAVQFGGVSPDEIIGPYVVVFMYMAVLSVLVTEVFSLINLVPDKVLRWIGDNSQSIGSHMKDSVLSGAKDGARDMAKQGAETMGNDTPKLAQKVAQHGIGPGTTAAMKAYQKWRAGGGPTPTPPSSSGDPE